MILSQDIVRSKVNVRLCFGPLIRQTSSYMDVTNYMSAPTIDRYWLFFFRKDNPQQLDHISNKRLKKYAAEIGELRFTMFHIEGAKNYLADQGSRFPTGGAGNDKGDGSFGEGDSAKKIGAAGAKIRANTACSWPPMVLPTDACYPSVAQIFVYGAESPSEDAEVHDEETLDSVCLKRHHI